MFAVFHLISLLVAFLRLGITTVKLNPDPSGGTEQAGALVPNAALLTQLGALSNNASPAFGNWSQTLIANSSSAATYSGQQMVAGLIRRGPPAGATLTDCTDTATNIIAAIPGAKVNQSWLTFVLNMGSTALTVAAGTGVTLTGTALVQSNSGRLFQGTVTGSTAVTFASVFAFPLGSLSPLSVAQ